MKLRYLIPVTAILILAGCQKEPASVMNASGHTAPEKTCSIEASFVPESFAQAVSTLHTEGLSSEPSTEECASVTEPSQEMTDPPSNPPETTESASPAPKETEPRPTEPTPTEPTPTEPPKPSEPAHTHSYQSTVIAPTCTAKGYTEYRCSCGDDYKDNYTDALGHSFTEQSIAATCTSGGYTLRTCSRCGATETTDTTPVLGHDYRDTVVAPTTTSEGYTEHTCSRCGDSYRDSYTDKIKEVFDLQAVIEYGCFYAQNLGFTIDRSMNLSNSGYYPGYYGGGYSLDFLKQRVAGLVQDTADMLTADGDTIPGFRCFIHASYDQENDKYYIVVLYG